MRLAAAAVTFLLLTGTAFAQNPGVNLWANDGKAKDPDVQAKQDEIDKAYRAKIQSQKPAAQAPVTDPWGNVRASETPQSKQGTKAR